MLRVEVCSFISKHLDGVVCDDLEIFRTQTHPNLLFYVVSSQKPGGRRCSWWLHLHLPRSQTGNVYAKWCEMALCIFGSSYDWNQPCWLIFFLEMGIWRRWERCLRRGWWRCLQSVELHQSNLFAFPKRNHFVKCTKWYAFGGPKLICGGSSVKLVPHTRFVDKLFFYSIFHPIWSWSWSWM